MVGSWWNHKFWCTETTYFKKKRLERRSSNFCCRFGFFLMFFVDRKWPTDLGSCCSRDLLLIVQYINKCCIGFPLLSSLSYNFPISIAKPHWQALHPWWVYNSHKYSKWMSSNFLPLNPGQTEVLVFAEEVNHCFDSFCNNIKWCVWKGTNKVIIITQRKVIAHQL